MPETAVPVNEAALLVQLVPVPPVPARVARSLITTEFGRTPVSVLLIKSFCAESETSPFGVTRQEQHEINCSSGEKVYTFAQMLPAAPPIPGPKGLAPFAPVFVMFTTESPACKFDA